MTMLLPFTWSIRSRCDVFNAVCSDQFNVDGENFSSFGEDPELFASWLWQDYFQQSILVEDVCYWR